MTKTDTAEIVYGMMTESTGIHMLDSGGGSGRAWQRNQKFSAEDFMNSPKACLDWGASISIFHFFCEFLEHDPKIQAIIDEVADENPKESWFDIRRLAIGGLCYSSGYKFHNTYNTYNDHDSIHLSQVFEGSEMEDDYGVPFLIVMLHNGADVRGGYTKPYAFRYKHGWEDFVTGMMDYELFCTDHDCDFSLSVRGLDTFDRDGNYVPDAILWEHVSEKTCPKCNKQTLDIDVNW
jgi:hypothetical protein